MIDTPKEWSDVLISFIPATTMMVGILVATLLTNWKVTSNIVNKALESVKDILAIKDRLMFVSTNFEIFQEVTRIRKNAEPIYTVLDSEIENTMELLNSNFSNGSKVDKALSDIIGFRSRSLQSIVNQSDLVNKEQYVILVDVIFERLGVLINSLSMMADVSIKPVLITGFTSGLHTLVDYFNINLTNRYTRLSEEQIKMDLINKFKLYNSRVRYSRDPVM